MSGWGVPAPPHPHICVGLRPPASSSNVARRSLLPENEGKLLVEEDENVSKKRKLSEEKENNFPVSRQDGQTPKKGNNISASSQNGQAKKKGINVSASSQNGQTQKKENNNISVSSQNGQINIGDYLAR